MDSIFKESKISIKDIQLWSENPRFPAKYIGKNEEELIDYIVSIPHYQIKSFGSEIVADFDMPIFEKLALHIDGNRMIALEGNRRITVYKLLVNPMLTSDVETQEHFKELKQKLDITQNFKIDCITSTDRSQILRYVDRKHLKKNNEVPWGDLERSNAKLRWLDSKGKQDMLKSSISITVQKLDLSDDEKDDILGPGFVTTFFRLISSKSAAIFFQLYFDDNNDVLSSDLQFYRKLERIIVDVLQKKEFNNKKFSRLNAEEITAYLGSIKIENGKNLLDNGTPVTKRNNEQENKQVKNDDNDNKASINIGEKKSSESSSAATAPKPQVPNSKVNKKTTSRRYLIPSNCKLTINEPKINNIYRELKDDLILDDSSKAVPNAAGVLFRVFLEVSIDNYAKKQHGHQFGMSDTISNKIPWVVERLISKGYTKQQLSNISTVASAKKGISYLSIERFHEYVHSLTVQPTNSELKLKWDNLQAFFEILFKETNMPKK